VVVIVFRWLISTISAAIHFLVGVVASVHSLPDVLTLDKEVQNKVPVICGMVCALSALSELSY
jgi:hypothetical protein